MLNQDHEPFFSFTVPPKPTHIGLHQYPSQTSHQASLLPSFLNDLHPPSTLEPSPGSPPAHNRPSTAGQFAFNVSSVGSSAAPPSALNDLVPNKLSISTSSFDTSLDRPYSSSGLSIAPSFPQTMPDTQTYGSSCVVRSQEVLKPVTRSSFADLASNSHPSTFTSRPHYAILNRHGRPMTAPGPACKGGPGESNVSQFSLAQAELFGQMSSYPLQPTGPPELSQTASTQAEPTNIHYLIQSSPGSSSVPTQFGGTTPSAPLNSSSGSSQPKSRMYSCISREASGSFAHPNSELPHRESRSGRPSFGTCSSGSTPESTESLEGDHSHPQSYVHSTPPNLYNHLVRPSTHSGTLHSFDEDRFLSQTLIPRPATDYLHHYDFPSAHVPTHSQSHEFPPRYPAYPELSSQNYPTSSGNHARGPGYVEPKSLDRLYNFNVLSNVPPKRARRRYDEVERIYCCNYPGCTKAYGTLNHLNAHASMQKHGAKRLPSEFKEIRKEWRAKKKAESEVRAATKHSSTNAQFFGSHDALRLSQMALSCHSSPSYTIPSPTVGGSYSAPAHSQHFTTMDHPNAWHNVC